MEEWSPNLRNKIDSVAMNVFDAHCTWEAVDGKKLTKTVSWLDRKESLDIEDIIQAENCVLLEATLDQPECRLRLSSAAPHYIQEVSVLCEARLLEVFGNHREYLQTVRGAIVDEMEDMIVYRGDVPFPQPVSECTLKFAALKNKSKMWLYGVVVKVQTVQPSTPAPLEERLHDPSHVLASQLLRMVSSSARGTASPAPSPGPIKTERGSQTDDKDRHEKDTQTIAEEKEETVPITVEASTTAVPSSSGQQLLCGTELTERLSESISASVECCLEQMEQRLWNKMQQRIQEMENRINHRIQEIVDALKDEEDELPEEGEDERDEDLGEEVAL